MNRIATASAIILLAAAPAVASAKTASVKGPGYSKTFTVKSCKATDESAAVIKGTAPDLTLAINARFRSGTLVITGAGNVSGRVTSTAVGDTGRVTIRGTFTRGTTGPFTVRAYC